jgi:hypothetical protein
LTLPAAVTRWIRAIHRDMGYVAVGLTFVYAVSGLAVNHIADWDPNFRNTTRELDVKVSASQSDDDIAAIVATAAGIAGKPKEVYREGDDLEILYDRRTLHVNLETGHVLEERQQPRFFVRVANWLHLNRGKKAWKYFADGYAAGLLLLATSGLFMLPSKRRLLNRKNLFVGIGIAIPVLYVTLSHAP